MFPHRDREVVMRYQAAVRVEAKITSVRVPVGSGPEIRSFDA